MNCEIGLEIAKLSNSWAEFESAIERLAKAEDDFLDTELGGLLTRWRRHAEGLVSGTN